jgi:hypothetical protein
LARNAVAKRKARNKINPDTDLAPGIAAGITEGDETLPAKPIRPLQERVGHMRGEETQRPSRVRFVAEPNSAVVHFPDGRSFQDVDVIVNEEYRRQMQAGYRCLRCHEPQDEAFPKRCDVCFYPMRERQIMDCALEFDTDGRHVGPAKPISEYLDEVEMRAEKRRFEQKIAEGRSRGRHAKTS